MTDNGSQSGFARLPDERRRKKQELFQKYQKRKQVNSEFDELSNSKSSLEEEEAMESLSLSSTKNVMSGKKEDNHDDQVSNSTPVRLRSSRIGIPDRRVAIKKILAEKRNSRSNLIDNQDANDGTGEQAERDEQTNESLTENLNSTSRSEQIKESPRSARLRSPKKDKMMKQLTEKKRAMLLASQTRLGESNLSANDESDGSSETPFEDAKQGESDIPGNEYPGILSGENEEEIEPPEESFSMVNNECESSRVDNLRPANSPGKSDVEDLPRAEDKSAVEERALAEENPVVEEGPAVEKGRTIPEFNGHKIGVSKDSDSPSVNPQPVLPEPEAPHAHELMQVDLQKEDSQPYKENRWDTRSILQYPPDPPPVEEKPAETDSLWTTFDSPFDRGVAESQPIEDFNSEVELTADIVEEFRGEAEWSNVDEDHLEHVENNTQQYPSLSEMNGEETMEEKVSWDASKTLFDPKLLPQKSDDSNTDTGVDMFDATSWIVSEVSSSNYALSTNAGAIKMYNDDEKKIELAEEVPRGLQLQKTKPYPEDAPLLSQEEVRSEVDNTGEEDNTDKYIEEGILSQQERLTIYNQASIDQSSDDDNEEDISLDEKSEVSEPDEIQYVAADDEEDLVLFSEENVTSASAGHSDTDFIEPAPAFEPANIAADRAQLGGSADDSSTGYYNFDRNGGISLETTSSLKEDDSTAYSSLAGERFAKSVMTADSTGSAVETTQTKPSTKNSLSKYTSLKTPIPIPGSNKKQRSSVAVPLLPPPPEDKLRKWEESKQGYSTVPISSKLDESNRNDIDVKTSVVDAKKEKQCVAEGEIKDFLTNGEGSPVDPKIDESPMVVAANDESVYLSCPTTSDTVSIVTVTSPKKKRSEDSFSSPVHPSPRMASKFATATSAAAQTFEMKYLSLNEQETRQSQEESSELQNSAISSLFCAPDTIADTAASMSDSAVPPLSESQKSGSPSSPRKGLPMVEKNNENTSRDAGVDLVGGAFNCWNGNLDTSLVTETPEVAVEDSKRSEEITSLKNEKTLDGSALVSWLEKEVLGIALSRDPEQSSTGVTSSDQIRILLENDENLNRVCTFVAESVDKKTKAQETQTSTAEMPASSSSSSNLENGEADPPSKTQLSTFQLFDRSNMGPNSSQVHAANFVSFLHSIAKLVGQESPFGDENPFVLDIVGSSLKLSDDEKKERDAHDQKKMQTMVFDHQNGDATSIASFFYHACFSHTSELTNDNLAELPSRTIALGEEVTTSTSKNSLGTHIGVSFDDGEQNRNLIVPDEDICPFELAMCDSPSVLLVVLTFLGDPQAVCRMKQVNVFCNQIISENEHMVIRDAVRIGGLSMHLRPAFWIWVTLERFGKNATSSEKPSPKGSDKADTVDIHELESIGREGQWHSVISRDVHRAFGNMPPHKTGAHARDDSIVRALVTWGQNRLMKRGVKGGGEADPIPTVQSASGQPSRPRPVRQTTAPPPWETGDDDSNSEVSLTPTVSDWSAISPVGSFSSHFSTAGEKRLAKQDSEVSRNEKRRIQRNQRKFVKELALSGNALNNEMKLDLQNKLGFILHALAAAHDNLGYCQGMDYVVAHLLRVLQETVVWQARRGTLSSTIKSAKNGERMSRTAVEDTCVVEETVFRVMNSLLTTYNLRHMYWPELRCLKTVCRVFEKLIQLKLPVLADHFDHHELNIGMFALGWFQTLFLYLPSMPAKTVCHMWDIWLVERSFKIFFRVGTAILFLSQPILLNHELEGMMTYLNTFPDATLLRPDILIACALQIKVTNKMLLQFEKEVTGGI